ncbi:hypothetical protein BEL04_21470 [Mucilaginibacter sp. PPCGB 2223]|uniref:hypothetical protein n=1 Tax=Mucilaginibacter sp. PPCGB 2223 TaxID=1886027 RepID=UPI00082419A5|nr:hypothetical protein [Mucilaginibacter sp. PPCGB 2223]OCX50360.1 hypothetical protein BEL04_21470 [Mucilaginibacter sp. PPCGB 2223]
MTAASAIRKFITDHLDALIAGIAGFVLIHIFTKYSGVGISPDSIMYMSTARNLNEGLGYVYFGGKPIVAFPVFYPTFLAIAEFITRTDPVRLGPVLDGLLFGTLIFLSGVIMERFRFPSKVYKWVILLAIVLSPSLLEIYTYLWSETLFMVWVLVFFLAYHHYTKTHSVKSLIVLATVTALALITRYAGITLVGTGGLLLLCDSELKLKDKIRHILIFGSISVSLLIANLVRNNLVTHTGTGPRYKSLTSLSENMHYFGTVMCDWFTFGQKAYGLAFTITLLLIVAFVTVFLYNAFRNRAMYNSYENIALAFFIVYALFMILSATISRYERLNNRLLSHLFIPFLWGCTWWVPQFIRRTRAGYRVALTVLAVGIGLLFAYGEYQRDWQRNDDECDYGIPGYTDDDWNKSELINLMKTHLELFKPGYTVYNNACEAFYFFTGLASEYIPHKNDPKAIRKFLGQSHFYVVVFDKLPDPALLTIKDIQQRKAMTLIFHSADGSIYECDH